MFQREITPHPLTTSFDFSVLFVLSLWEAPGLQQYLASLDAENARMMTEIQGLSSGGAGGGGQHFGLTGLRGDVNKGLSPMFPGTAGAATGRGMAAAGYLGPGLHGNERVPQVEGGGGEQGEGGGGGAIAAASKRSRANGEKEGVGPEWDEELPGAGGEPPSPRNKEYRRKMIEMDAEHKVWCPANKGLGKQEREVDECIIASTHFGRTYSLVFV